MQRDGSPGSRNLSRGVIDWHVLQFRTPRNSFCSLSERERPNPIRVALAWPIGPEGAVFVSIDQFPTSSDIPREARWGSGPKALESELSGISPRFAWAPPVCQFE